MNKKILLDIDNRFVKAIILKSIAKAGLDVLDVIDKDDMIIKLEAFGDYVVLAVAEITKENLDVTKSKIENLRRACPSVPMLAIVYKDTSDIVSFALQAGIKDVLLLPKNSELYKNMIQAKLDMYYSKFNKPVEKKEQHVFEKIQEKVDIKESLSLELKRAVRGDYVLSFVMVYLSGNEPEVVKFLIQNVNAFMRDTDKILEVDKDTFIGVFPFTDKSYIPVIEEKIRDAFKSEISHVGIHKKLCLYSATYPHDGATIEALLDRMEMGINNSLVINSVNTPLNTMSKSEIEQYKKKIKQYKKFF